MIKIAVCDDVAEDRDALYELIDGTELFGNTEYTSFDSGGALVDAISRGAEFDIVFLDVQMKGINGIETGKQIYALNPKTVIIFVTNYPEYAIEAFECYAFHYVLKNERPEKFYEVIAKAHKRYVRSHSHYVVKCKEGPVSIRLSDLYCVEYQDKHVVFYTEDKCYKMRSTMGVIEKDLAEFGFVRVHQGYIVNLSKIQRFMKTDILLTNGQTVMLSTRKRTEVIEMHRKYIEEN